MQRNALILGSTGLVGGHLLEFLLAEDRYSRIVAPVRRPINSAHSKLQSPIINFDEMDKLSEFAPFDDYYCCLGTTMKQAGSQEAFYRVDFTYVVESARVAASAGAVRCFVVSSLGADPNSSIFYSRVKGEAEEKLREFDFQSLHIFRPSLLRGERKEARMGEKFMDAASSLFSFAFVGPLKTYRPIEARLVARAMVDAAFSDAAGVFVHESDSIQIKP